MDTNANNRVLLISFYNPQSLGLRYLENALTEHGYHVKVALFKGFNSVNPKKATEKEIGLLRELAEAFDPLMIGLSVMTSLYLETVKAVSEDLRKRFKAPLVWGGVYPTMFPETSLLHADFVVRGEGEDAIVELANALRAGSRDFSGIMNLAYTDGAPVINEIRELATDLDKYGIPDIGRDNKYLIENDAVTQVDPLLRALSYELGASRGCPFACTYCCSINLRRISSRGRFVRFREVDRVIEELLNAKKNIKNLKVIHFWDEVFCDDPGWVDDFVSRYKQEVGLPFEIWGHPLKTDEAVIRKLQGAGLYKVVMGIQSGSPYIRKEIFNRPENQEDIVKSSETLAKCKVPQVIYDFMLRHPFETKDTLKETFDLALRLARPFELQLHGLNFLPGTDIVGKAIDMGLVTPEQMELFMYAPISEQYDMYWKNENSDAASNFWYKLIYLLQFPLLRKQAQRLAAGEATDAAMAKADRLCKWGGILAKLRYYYKKGIIVIKGTVK